MPSHDRVRLHEDHRRAPVPPDSSQGDPEQPVVRLQVGAVGRPFHRHQLLPQREVLQHQFSMAAEPQRQGTTNDDQQLQHVSILAGVGATINPDEFWRGSAWNVILRTTGPADNVAASLRQLFRDENVLGGDLQTLRVHVRERLTRERLLSWLSGFFGVLAALLAAVGLYGVMSYSVARRSNEIAIRMALGAASGDVLRLMLGQAGLLLAVGLGIGCALALAIGRTAGTLLFGLQPNDPLSFAMSVLALGIVALAAAYLPAARATRMSPLDGLRAD